MSFNADIYVPDKAFDSVSNRLRAPWELPQLAFAAGMPETQLPPTVKPGAIGTNRDGRCYEVTPPRVREARVTDGLMG